MHANNPPKYELNRACITTRHPCSNNKSRPNNITERQKDRHGRDYRVSLLVSIVRDGDVNFCRDSSRADVSPPRIEWRSNRWRVLRTRSEWIFAACCSSTPIIIPLIVRDGIEPRRIRSWTMIVFRESGWNGNIRGEEKAVGSMSMRFGKRAVRFSKERL